MDHIEGYENVVFQDNSQLYRTPQDPITIAGQDPNIIRWQLEIEGYLERFEHYLKGHKRDYKNRKWITEDTIPMCNEYGINGILSFLSNELDKAITMSNLAERDVIRLAREARQNIVELVYMNWIKWELMKTFWNDLVVKVDHVIYSNLMRAYLQGERNYHKAVQSYKETRVVGTPMQPQKKAGILSGFS